MGLCHASTAVMKRPALAGNFLSPKASSLTPKTRSEAAKGNRHLAFSAAATFAWALARRAFDAM